MSDATVEEKMEMIEWVRDWAMMAANRASPSFAAGCLIGLAAWIAGEAGCPQEDWDEMLADAFEKMNVRLQTRAQQSKTGG